jgi:hypothetical protein
MRVRLQQYHDQHYGGSPMQKPSTPIQKETLMRVLSSLAFLQGYIAACVPSQGELGAEEQTNVSSLLIRVFRCRTSFQMIHTPFA